jgi:hypothetical protein
VLRCAAEAKAELLEFSRSSSASGAAPGLPAFLLSPTGAAAAAGGQTLAEQALTDRLLQLLAGVEPAGAPLSLEAALQVPPPQPQGEDGARLPLTW